MVEENLVEENNLLKQRMEIMEKQLAQLLKQDKRKTKAKETVSESGNTDKVPSDEYIKVMSLCPHPLNLATQRKGQGKLFTFEKFGEVKRILYKDLQDIIEVNRHFLEEGLFIILNDDVVRTQGLDELYTKILTKDKIEKILLGENQSDAVNLFKSAGPKQQDFIVDMLIEKLVSGVEIDLNLLDRLSRAYPRCESTKQSIQQMAEEAKAYIEINKNVKVR